MAATDSAPIHVTVERYRMKLFSRGEMHAKSRAPGMIAHDEVEIESSGETATGFIPRQIVTLVEALIGASPQSKQITMGGFIDRERALRFTVKEDEGLLRLAMPSRMIGPRPDEEQA